MKKVLILQLDQTEKPAFIVDYFDREGVDFEVRRLYENMEMPNVLDYSHLIVMPSPKDTFECESVPFLMKAKAVINEFLALDKSILGVCMGAQLIAECLGEEVGKAEAAEVGFYDIKVLDDVSLLEGLGKSIEVFEWHSMEIRTHRNIVVKANSENCKTQVFQYGINVFGLQFHIEVTPALVDKYLEVFDQKGEYAGLNGQREKFKKFKKIQDTILAKFIS